MRLILVWRPASSSSYRRSRRWQYLGREKDWRIPGPSRAGPIGRNKIFRHTDAMPMCQVKKALDRATSSVLASSAGVQRVSRTDPLFNPSNEPAVLPLILLVGVPVTDRTPIERPPIEWIRENATTDGRLFPSFLSNSVGQKIYQENSAISTTIGIVVTPGDRDGHLFGVDQRDESIGIVTAATRRVS
jgi:hypothetical protein